MHRIDYGVVMRSLTREQVREVDRLAIEELGVPGVVLMENAGRAVSDVVLGVLRERGVEVGASRVVVLCGGGNNGGDGYVVARHLHNAGVRVTVVAVKPLGDLKGDAAVHARVCAAMGIEVLVVSGGEEAKGVMGKVGDVDVVVDALLGTGFVGAVRGSCAGLIRWCNRQGGAVVAVDVPSGLDCDTGLPSDPTVRAGVTVTFIERKVGFDAVGASEYLGRAVVAGIGIPGAVAERVLGSV